MFFLLLFILPGIRTQDPTLPNYSPRPQQLFNTVQFLQQKPAKKGPILFPNDAPPPPPTPLIVTSRPLSESIARSDLNQNNSLAAQSQYHQVTFRPNYLARGKNYEPYSYTLTTEAPVYDYESKLDYSDTAGTVQGRKENFYKDYEPEQRPMESKTIVNNKDNGKQIKQTHASLYSGEDEYNTDDNSDYDKEFNDEDNNFDFDFKKLYSTTRKTLEANSSEYLEYYPDSKHVQRRHFARENDVRDFKKIPFIKSKEIPYRNLNGKAWHRLSDREKRSSSNSAGDSEEIEAIIGLPPSHSVMRNVKHKGSKSITKNYEWDRGRKKFLQNSRIREMPQLRDQKPLYEYNNVQGQQYTAPKADPYKYKDPSEQFHHSKPNVDDHDYNKENNHGDNYAFSYTVKDHKTGDDFSHSQKSTGSATNGEYRVRLPDGRMQIVSYTADENGYKADVRYDEHHNLGNSIDFDHDKDKGYRNNDPPATYKHNYAYNDHVVHQDSFENEEFLHRPVKPTPKTYKSNIPDNFEHINDYRNKNDNFQYYSVYPTKSAYVDTTEVNNIKDQTLDGLSDNNNDYLDHYKTLVETDAIVERAKDDYKFSDEIDLSKEELDYHQISDLEQPYQPHKSKFSTFANNQNPQAQVRPSYNELKDLFVTNVNGRRNAAIAALPVVSTVRPVYAVTPENIVAITPKKPNLYTNIKNIISVSPASFLVSTPSPSTPRSYLFSTIANLKHQISLASKPVLSNHYINKINKYLSYANPTKIDG